MYFSIPIERVVIVRSQITKRRAVFQHVVYGDQHGMCNRKCGTVLTSSCGDPLVLRREIRPFYRTCRFCTLGQNRLERFVAFCCFPVLSPSCALAVAGANPSPGTKMGGTGKSAHKVLLHPRSSRHPLGHSTPAVGKRKRSRAINWNW